MAKRLKHDIYRALGEYVINRNSRLLNEEQLKVAKEYKPICHFTRYMRMTLPNK
ncbi:TPA: hypothetical protein PI735_001034 [Staphylococcus aureus]|nr:hypothetical protein [Staphylococcus aureus]